MKVKSKPGIHEFHFLLNCKNVAAERRAGGKTPPISGTLYKTGVRHEFK
ncbi:MAG: hypothetical protein KBC20_01995 [Oscillospiraceae bacterium]|nr:hypothetical protein [Oscillospiraceae bacterium]